MKIKNDIKSTLRTLKEIRNCEPEILREGYGLRYEGIDEFVQRMDEAIEWYEDCIEEIEKMES
jgi:hypothetical protein